ncbi:MAG: Re/Si-specific NAD(P)(+) transhydrogenase subunit alpha [Candidatus Lutacidiplasmatales archaeon]
MGARISVPREVAPGERRVALVPEIVGKLVASGLEVRIEAGAGSESYYLDEPFAKAGAQVIGDRKAIFAESDVILKVQAPTIEEVGWAKTGAIFIGFMNPTRNLETVRKMRDAGVTAFALELLPRITRAQGMDALSSQATVAGYRAALLGAEHCPKFLPMLTTAAGTIRPAKVLILGAGVAGLMAIATAKRLGAVVEGYDVRRAAGEQVRSLGAKFLELQINAEGTGGYARELTDAEKAQEREMVAKAVAEADVVITTANIPGKKAPRLVTSEMVARMRPGSVIIDLAAESGGNCESTKAGELVVDHGVSVVGALNLPSEIPFHASQMLAKNLQNFLGLLVGKDGKVVDSFADEILAASLLVHKGEVTHGPTRDLLGAAPS